LRIFSLAPVATLLGEVARLQNRCPNLTGRESYIGGVTRPGHIGMVKIAGIMSIAVKFCQRSQRLNRITARAG
jgi:hypothetical protein